MADNANTTIFDKSVDRAAMIRYYEERVGGKINSIMDGNNVDVMKLIAESKVKSPQFAEELDNLLVKNYGKLHDMSKRSLMDLIFDQTSYMVQNLDNAIGKIWSVSKPQYRIAEDIALNRPLYNDMTLLQGWQSVSIAERKRLEGVIRKGIADGDTEAQIALNVRKGNVFNISRTQSLGLVRTAMTSVVVQTDHEVYKANEKALQGWQYVAVLDSRTTPLCAHRDGTVYPISDTTHLPPAHWNCRSTTVPVVYAWQDLAKLEGVAQVRKKNLANLSLKQQAFYDGQTPLKESYQQWLMRQTSEVQLRHLGDFNRLEAFRTGQLELSGFTNDAGNSIGIKELRQLTANSFTAPGDTIRFANAKEKMDAIQLGVNRPEDLIDNKTFQANLREYYILQNGDLDGNLSLTNYRGTLLGNKKATKVRVLSSPPKEENLKFNPLTGRYEDARMYQPSAETLENNLRQVRESALLKPQDKEFIENFVNGMFGYVGTNEQAVISDNLRIIFGRFRDNKEPWGNFKAVVNGQIKFDVMNVSDYMETQLRKDGNLLLRLKQDNYIDPVLGTVQLQDLSDSFIDNINAKNAWEDKVAPKIAKELRGFLDLSIPFKIRTRLDDEQLQAFYLRFANRLSLSDTPDRDQLAISLGRDLFNSANYRGSRNEWYQLGLKMLDTADKKGFYNIESFTVQKRRMKSRLSNAYFGPYYDTTSVNLRIVDPRIQEYSQLTRKVDVGLRLGVSTERNRLYIRPGYKTYHTKGLLGYSDTRIPITSTNSFGDFPDALVDDSLADALNWASQTKYKVDPDFHDFIVKLMNFEDDKGNAAFYHGLNQYRSYITERGDAYERFKAMKWLRDDETAFSNAAFVDHRARVYDRGMISPQSGETFRPFLNTAETRKFSADGYANLQDQIGAFLGGLTDALEGRHNSLAVLGRQKIAEEWRNELVTIGYQMRRAKPNDIRKVLESEFMALIDGEEQGKAMRFAIEMSKIDEYLGGDYSAASIQRLKDYDIAVALEQDASSSGAQIIALTTKNKQLGELSNVVATNQKQRLYDEIAAATFNDPRFIELNQKLGLSEKDLRKAAKAQNMVTFYGAGDKTGILNVEAKLAKVLGKDTGTLVVKASDRDKVLNEISARMARYQKIDPDMFDQLRTLRQDVRDIFNKGQDPGDDILTQLYFLEPKTRDLVEKLSRNYTNIVTPQDFSTIANIMSENLATQVPILKDFTKFFGRLAEDFVTNAKPSNSRTSITDIIKTKLLAERQAIPDIVNRVPGFNPNSTLTDILYGVRKVEQPRLWTNIPWVNFDGKIIEQNFTQVFEEKLTYKNAEGKWITNIIQAPQKTDPTFWEELLNEAGTMNDIVDAQKARTAFAVNGNHSNDAVIVKKFHQWGLANNIPTSTIHDAFFTNAADMLTARTALRGIYGDLVETSPIESTLTEMLNRGLPKEIYNKYLNEAKDIGLIPVVGRSRVGGKLLTKDDILTKEQILAPIPTGFKENRYWYGIG